MIPGLSSPDPGVLERALKLLPADGDRSALVLAAAALGVAPAQLRVTLEALAFAAGPRDTILASMSRAPALAQQLSVAQRPSEIADTVAGAPVELVALAGALGDAPAASAAHRWLGELRHVGLEIDGDDLLAAGVVPGPELGAGLRAALAARLDGRAHGRDRQLAEALRVARGA
jgi:hypothetical protein